MKRNELIDNETGMMKLFFYIQFRKPAGLSSLKRDNEIWILPNVSRKVFWIHVHVNGKWKTVEKMNGSDAEITSWITSNVDFNKYMQAKQSQEFMI